MIKNSQFFLVKACTKIFFEKFRMLERGRSKRSSIFQALHPGKKSMLPKANDQKKEDDLSDLSPKNNSESFDEN